MAVSGKLSRRGSYAATFATTLPRRVAGSTRSTLTHRAATDTFYREGVVAQLDEWGVERFNFLQQIWLYPHIAMGSNGVAPREVLAVNILTRLIRVRDIRVFIGATSRRALRLAPAFVEECLSGTQPHWKRYTIPIAALRAWVALKR